MLMPMNLQFCNRMWTDSFQLSLVLFFLSLLQFIKSFRFFVRDPFVSATHYDIGYHYYMFNGKLLFFFFSFVIICFYRFDDSAPTI